MLVLLAESSKGVEYHGGSILILKTNLRSEIGAYLVVISCSGCDNAYSEMFVPINVSHVRLGHVLVRMGTHRSNTYLAQTALTGCWSWSWSRSLVLSCLMSYARTQYLFSSAKIDETAWVEEFVLTLATTDLRLVFGRLWTCSR
ncbi:hypothetical protein Tco_0398289 [Tanacetum coccineum]